MKKPSASDVLGFSLFAITAVYSVEYFAGNTASLWDAIKAGAMALAFEAGKIILWRRGWDTHNPLFVLVSLPFFCISFIASGGSALVYMNKGANETAGGNYEIQDIRSRIAQADTQIQLLQRRLDTVSADPTASTVSLRNEIAKDMELREKLSSDLVSKSSTLRSYGSEDAMGSLSSVLHIRKDTFELWYMLGRAILLELGAATATVPSRKRNKGNTIQDTPTYARSSKLSLAHILRSNPGDKKCTTYCGLGLPDPVAATDTTPVCMKCIKQWEKENGIDTSS